MASHTRMQMLIVSYIIKMIALFERHSSISHDEIILSMLGLLLCKYIETIVKTVMN